MVHIVRVLFMAFVVVITGTACSQPFGIAPSFSYLQGTGVRDSNLMQDKIGNMGSYSPSQSSGDISIHQTSAETSSVKYYHMQHLQPAAAPSAALLAYSSRLAYSFPSPPYSDLFDTNFESIFRCSEANASAVASSCTTYPPPPMVGINIPVSTYAVLESNSVKAYHPEQEQEQQSQPVGQSISPMTTPAAVQPLYAASSYRESLQLNKEPSHF